MNHPCYNSGACCNAPCYAESNDDESCWGDVEVVDEDCWDDGEGRMDYSWIHACQGHMDVWAHNEKYKPKPMKALIKAVNHATKNMIVPSQILTEPLCKECNHPQKDHYNDGYSYCKHCNCGWTWSISDSALNEMKKETVQIETRDLFKSLTPEEYEAVKAPTKEEIQEALRKGQEDMDKARRIRVRLGDDFYKAADAVGGTETSGIASGEPLTKITGMARLAEYLGYDEKADREIDALVAKAREKEKIVPMIPVSEEGNKLVDELLNQNLDKNKGNDVLQTWECRYCKVQYPFTVLRCSDCGQMIPESREEKLIKVLRNLVNRLEKIQDNDSFKSVWSIYFSRGLKYTGPNWVEELKAAKKILDQ